MAAPKVPRDEKLSTKHCYDQSVRGFALALARSIALSLEETKDDIAIVDSSHRDVHSPKLVTAFTDLFAAASPFMRCWCQAPGLSY